MTPQIFKFLNTFKNAQKKNEPFFFFTFSKNTLKFLEELKKEGFINYFQLVTVKNRLLFKIFLYRNKSIPLSGLFKASWKNKNFSKGDFWKLQSGASVVFFKSSLGIVTGRTARIKHFGGVFLCNIL